MTMWTNEQLSAINAKTNDILVSAAAGSGKTAILVERIIKLITDEENPIDIDKLLIVTFTNAAANQMREKIFKALIKRVESGDLSNHIKRQLVLINRAKITTIHSFCLEVIRQNFNLLDIDPSFRIADETEILILKNESLDILLENNYERENNDDFIGLVDFFDSNFKNTQTRKNILSLYQFSRSNPFPYDWFSKALNLYDIKNLENKDKLWFFLELRKEIQNILFGAKEMNQKANLIIEEFNVLEYEKAFKSDMTLIDTLLNSLQNDSIFDFYDKHKSYSFETLGRKKKDSDEAAISYLKSIRDEFKSSINSVFSDFLYESPENLLNDMQLLYSPVKKLFELVMEFSDIFQAKKKEKNIIDFNDIEHFCIKILFEDGSTEDNYTLTEVAKNLKNSFYEIFIDEYQDSNLVQEMILESISKKSLGKNNRFMVGDVKQSIYKFRLARPELFIDKYKKFIPAENVSDNDTEIKIDLSKNFRSRKEVLNSINFLFKQVMSDEFGDVTYNEKAMLYNGYDYPENENAGGKTELVLIDASSSKESTDMDFEEAWDISNTEREAFYIAQRIEDIIKSGYMVFDKDKNEFRKALYKDIVILLRSPSTWTDILSEALKLHNIPFYAENSSKYFETLEIDFIVNILKLINNPIDDIPLISILYSPVFDFDFDDLAEIKKSFAELNKKNYWYFINEYEKNGEDEYLKSKISKFLNMLNSWRDFSEESTLSETIERVINDTLIFDYAGTLSGGEGRQSNIRVFKEKAYEFEKTGEKSLFKFIRYLDNISLIGYETGAAKYLSENENLVRIMSIHKSKGLEFPIVFVSGLGKKFNMTDLYAPLIFHQEMGVGLDYMDTNLRVSYKTIGKTVVAKRIKNENYSEELRILYVALTRAKEKLILTGVCDNLQKKMLKWNLYSRNNDGTVSVYNLRSAVCYLDFVVPPLINHSELSSFLEETKSFDFYSEEKADNLFDIKIIYGTNTIKEETQETKYNNYKYYFKDFDTNKDYTDRKQEIYDLINYKYPKKDFIEIPANISVSEIKRINNKDLFPLDTEFYYNNNIIKELPMPSLYIFEEEKELSAAERGTIVHSFLEKTDIKKINTLDDIICYKEYYKEKGIFTTKELSVIDENKILKFAISNIGKRIKNSEGVFKEKHFTLSVSPYELYKEDKYKEASENVLVHGIIDLFFFENNEIVLLDFKTDSLKNTTSQKIAEKYRIQLDIYKKALEKIYNKKVKGTYLYLFDNDEEVLV